VTALWNHFLLEFRTGLRNTVLLFLNYLLPLGFYAMMGMVMIQLNPLFRGMMIQAMTMFAILSGMLLGLPGPLVEAREAGIYRNYRVHGIPAAAVLSLPALSTMVHVLAAAAIITATAPYLFQAPPPVNWAGFVFVSLLTSLTYAGLGVLVAVISSSSRVTIFWSQLLYLPTMLIGGVMFPSELLPESLRRAGLLLPSTYAMEGYRALAWNQAGAGGAAVPLLILLAGGILAFSLAAYLFVWDNRNATRRGHPALAALALLPYVLGAWLG